jgi:hypothetical protein
VTGRAGEKMAEMGNNGQFLPLFIASKSGAAKRRDLIPNQAPINNIGAIKREIGKRTSNGNEEMATDNKLYKVHDMDGCWLGWSKQLELGNRNGKAAGRHP